MAEMRDMEVRVDIRFDTSYPKVPSTMEDRIRCAVAAKPLLAGTTPITSSAVGVSELIRLAEYLATGHDYFDTHPSKGESKPSKKERRRAAKEIRKIVVEEVEEEFDRRQTMNAGTLIMPRVLIQEEDGSLTDTQPEMPNPWAPKDEDEEGKGDE